MSKLTVTADHRRLDRSTKTKHYLYCGLTPASILCPPLITTLAFSCGGLLKGFLCVFCVFYLPGQFVYFLFLCVYFSRLFCVVSSSASDCLASLVSEMTYYVSSET